MKLYHYSKEMYESLKTRRLTGNLTPHEIEQEEKAVAEYSLTGPHIDHISFFFDPVPLDILGKLFKGKNKFWITNATVIEYVIDTSDLEHDILFDVVESPSATKMIDDTEWIDTPEFLKKFKAGKAIAKRGWGEIGIGVDLLKKQIALHVGNTRNAYITASLRNDFDENIEKYAANVPHVMLYPKSGKIEYQKTRKVVIGQLEETHHTTFKKYLRNS